MSRSQQPQRPPPQLAEPPLPGAGFGVDGTGQQGDSLRSSRSSRPAASAAARVSPDRGEFGELGIDLGELDTQSQPR
ncbi:hypothetical protein A9310_10955 [Gordonia sp. UCD-TK1]|uniref:Uncharacterized protein n=1 Tax=Gordonia jacobaea TaxID=122202 RepID=A0ABR5I6R8_9ACTN|nr:hypothetical protein ABW18_21530 [Gordonia jacobaea]MAU82327.1 hypothetical protein [Gordonia sp. (in: high G+C Gram-positive bacteria)]OBA73445.1 hypothetical protein A5777_10375 [Gordonia sp. 852002-10350_SCH5691597]OCH82819.1 hypothetical protein A9310_10955 [Gordonia sp. UCD-TK1]OCW83967.1 hypothetical protein A8M60_12895 [Nocardia farcinica]